MVYRPEWKNGHFWTLEWGRMESSPPRFPLGAELSTRRRTTSINESTLSFRETRFFGREGSTMEEGVTGKDTEGSMGVSVKG